MRAGVSTATLFLRLNNEDALPLFDEWGIPCAEVFLTSFSEYKPAFARELKTKKGKVEAFSVHVLNTQFEPQLYAAHPRVRADAYFWLGQAMTSAKTLGAKYYSFHGIARLKRTFREDIARTAEQTAQISAFCKKFGVKLCYENVEWAFFNRPDLFAPLKEGCKELGGVLDLKQARVSGYDYSAYLDAMAGSITHVHASDVDENGKLCLPGEGVFDFDLLFSRLRDTGFDGPVFIENYAGDYKELSEIKRSYEFLAEKAEKYSR